MEMVKYKELKKWIFDGAIIEGFIEDLDGGGEWKEADPKKVLIGKYDHKRLRVKPDCQYANNTIREHGGMEVLNTYKFWLSGGTIVDTEDGDIVASATLFTPPFESFLNIVKEGWKLAKKQQQVLWVSDWGVGNIPKGGNKVHADWFDEGVDPNSDSLDFVWHKVPTLIQNNVRFLL